ncbi:cytochrome c oxidase subunit 4 isoform 1, mitochondrial-like [Mytilus galloprovincialis]|uniref:cytochrome c oxidase subunit 4 isoform 1, mitochondrial-like n=1 Tax=Mytilus galloprovincialis TaxID=29158 RepID=UPI003F7B827D
MKATMSFHILKSSARAANKVPLRSVSTTSVCKQQEVVTLSQTQKDKFYPKIGNRDIVGSGYSVRPCYEDRTDYPFPALKWKANTPDVVALKDKELGEWKNLTMEERKDLYRASFCQTFSEMNAPTGEWKQIFSATLLVCTASALWMWWCEHFIFAKQLPESMTPEYKKKVIERMIKQGQQQMTGISAQYDFEEKKWKGNKWW